MNINNLDDMPAVENELNIDLIENEKIVFSSNFPSSIYNRKGQLLAGIKNKIILTNYRLILYTGAGFFIFDLKEDIQDCVEVERKFIIKIGYYYLVTLKNPVEYEEIGGKKRSLDAVRLEFNNPDRAKFTKLMGLVK